MPDFTIIEGGMAGKDPVAVRAEQRAQTLLMDLIIAALRGVARGREDGGFTRSFDRLIEHMAASDVHLWRVANSVFDEARSGDEFGCFTNLEDDESWVVLNALRLAAEALADDNAAGGRRSKRRREFDESIMQWVLESEELARRSGWSLLADLKRRADRQANNGRSSPVSKGDEAIPRMRSAILNAANKSVRFTQDGIPRRRKTAAAATPEQIAYIKSLGVPLAVLHDLIGPIENVVGSLQHSIIATSLKGHTKQRVSITDVSHKLIPALQLVTEEDLVR